MMSSYLLMRYVERSRAARLRSSQDKPVINQEYESRSNIDKCRACLQTGVIPIFGDDESPDISESVRTFGDIEVNENDNFPRYLCDSCHKLLQAAILFRTSAKQTQAILKQPIKSENSTDCTYGNSSYYDPNDYNVEDIEDTETKKFFMEKKTKKYHCKVCYVDFKTLDEYYDHVSTSEHRRQKLNPNIQCKICNKTLRKYYFKQHLELHKTEKLYKMKCKICKKLYKKGEYKEHLASHDSPQVNYVCEVCGRSFLRRNVYKCHVLTHTTEFPFECEFCPYRGRNMGLLKVHMRTHTRDYRYQCTECSSRFLTSSNLNRHMAKHRGRNVECDNCKRRFYSKNELEQHYKVDHLGIKDHVCNLCGKAFGYRNAMKKHQVHVHKREKFTEGKGRVPAYLEFERNKEVEVMEKTFFGSTERKKGQEDVAQSFYVP